MNAGKMFTNCLILIGCFRHAALEPEQLTLIGSTLSSLPIALEGLPRSNPTHQR